MNEPKPIEWTEEEPQPALKLTWTLLAGRPNPDEGLLPIQRDATVDDICAAVAALSPEDRAKVAEACGHPVALCGATDAELDRRIERAEAAEKVVEAIRGARNSSRSIPSRWTPWELASHVALTEYDHATRPLDASTRKDEDLAAPKVDTTTDAEAVRLATSGGAVAPKYDPNLTGVVSVSLNGCATPFDSIRDAAAALYKATGCPDLQASALQVIDRVEELESQIRDRDTTIGKQLAEINELSDRLLEARDKLDSANKMLTECTPVIRALKVCYHGQVFEKLDTLHDVLVSTDYDLEERLNERKP